MPPLFAILEKLLIPVAAIQAGWVALRAVRLPEAGGPREGRAGQGAALRVLVLGDSSAAGVGLASQDQAFSGQLVKRLSGHFDVRWRLIARTGATSGAGCAMLDAAPDERFDVAILAFGVNDTTRLRSRARWRADQAALRQRLRARFGVRLMVVSAVPPLHRFPLLPWPLRTFLGRRAQVLDQSLARDLSGQSDCKYLPFDVELKPEMMAQDGYHPGPDIHAIWAARAADTVLAWAEPDQFHKPARAPSTRPGTGAKNPPIDA